MSRGRPRALRGSISADQIVDAACVLVATAGFDKFSMPELARRLEVGVTSLYWYFRSKEELLRAIADRATAEFYDGLDDDVGLAGDDRVLQQFRLYWTRLRENALWREVFTSGFVRAASALPEGGRRAGAVVQRQIDRMIDAGLAPSEAAEAYRILSSYTRGSVVVAHADVLGASSVPEEHITSVVDSMTGPAREAWAGLPDDDTLFELGLRALWAGLLERSRARA